MSGDCVDCNFGAGHDIIFVFDECHTLFGNHLEMLTLYSEKVGTKISMTWSTSKESAQFGI